MAIVGTCPLSLACTSAPCCRRYSTTDTLLYPAAKWSGVDWRPSMSLQLTLWTVHNFYRMEHSVHMMLHILACFHSFSRNFKCLILFYCLIKSASSTTICYSYFILSFIGKTSGSLIYACIIFYLPKLAGKFFYYHCYYLHKGNLSINYQQLLSFIFGKYM